MGVTDNIVSDKKLQQAAEEQAANIADYLGLDLDPNLQMGLRTLIGVATDPAREFIERNAVVGTDKFLQAIGKKDAYPNTPYLVAKVLGYATVLLPQIITLWRGVRKIWNDYSEFWGRIGTLPKGVNEGNFIIGELRAQTYLRAKHGLTDIAAQAIDAAPNIYLAHRAHKIRDAWLPIGEKVDPLWEKEKIKYKYNLDERQKTFRADKVDEFRKSGTLSEEVKNYTDLAEKAAEQDAYLENLGGKKFLGGITPAITSLVQKLLGTQKKRQQPTPIFEMIEKLAVEVGKDPEAKHYNVAGGRTTLEGAVAAIIEETAARRYHDRNLLPQKRLKEVSQQIAEAIREDGLNPMALVELAGSSKVLLNKNGDLLDDAGLEKLLETTITRYAKQAPIKSENYYKETQLTRESLKGLWDASKDSKEEQALLLRMMPVNVGMEITGLSRRQVRHLQKTAERQIHDSLATAMLQIAQMPEEELNTLGFSAREKEEIQAWAVKIKRHGIDAVGEGIGNAREPGIEAIALRVAAKDPEKAKSWAERAPRRGGNLRGSAEHQDEELSAPDENTEELGASFANKFQQRNRSSFSEGLPRSKAASSHVGRFNTSARDRNLSSSLEI